MRLGEFKRYEKYKDSGVEWIGEVPVDWTISKIKYSTYVKGRIGWQGLRADEFIDEGPFLVTGTDFMNGEINWDTCYHVSLERYNEAPAIQLKEGDLLITKDGTIGKVAIVYNKPEKAILNSGIFVTRALGDRYFSKYMYWLLNSCIFNIYIDFTKTGSTIVHLYQETFEDFSFPLPSIKDQKQIIDFLDQKTSEIDSLIADKEKLIALLQEQRQAIISEAVTKGLDKNVKMKDSGIEWIGEVPEHWRKTYIKYIVDQKKDSIVDGPFGSSINVSTDYVDSEEGVPIIRTVNINDDKFIEEDLKYLRFEKYEELKKHTVYPGDVLFSKVGTIGNTCIFPNHIAKGILSTTGSCKITANKSQINNRFFMFKLLSMKEHFNVLASSNVQPFLNMTTIKNVSFYIPDLLEQTQILDYLDKKVVEFDELINLVNIQILKLKEYRQSLISEAVTGMIMV